MDTSSLEKRVTDTIGELHGVFDEIGLPRNEREVKESEVRFNGFGITACPLTIS